MEEKTKKSIIILMLGIASFGFMLLGIKYANIPQVLSLVCGIFAYILNFDEKRNGSFSPISSIGVFIGFACGAISIIMIIQSLA